MRQHTHRRILMSILIIALGAVLVGCAGTPGASPTEATPEGGAPGGQVGPTSGSPSGQMQEQLAMLGITGRPSDDTPKGLLVTGFLPSEGPWPLQTLGVKVGDAIIMVNDQPQQIGSRLVDAFDGLQNRGEPITVVVLRDDNRVTLQRSEKFPAPDTGEEPE